MACLKFIFRTLIARMFSTASKNLNLWLVFQDLNKLSNSAFYSHGEKVQYGYSEIWVQ